MADKQWLGRALKVKQINTITVAGPVVIGETWTITINAKDLTFTATAATTGNVVDGLLALLQAATAPAEFQEADWTSSGDVITMTAKDEYAGWDITQTSSTDSAGGTLVTATTSAATGPMHADNVDNWSGGSLPVDTDNIYFGAAEYGPMMGLSALSSVTPALVDISPIVEYQIGLPRLNASGNYTEYRSTNLQLDGCTLFRMRGGDGTGSPLVRVDFGSGTANTAILIEKTGASAEANAPAFNFIGTDADTTLEVRDGGEVGIGFFGGEACTVKTITQSGGSIVAGPGATLDGAGSTATISGGSFNSRTNLLTVTVEEGAAVTIDESATVTTLTINSGGSVFYNSDGTCTTLNLYGSIDCTADRSGRTFTNVALFPGYSFAGVQSCTFTNGWAPNSTLTSSSG